MSENNGKKREWVKTAAIIFLSVLLVLTFFSNTIMNYSLPEVATQYVEPGSITAQIRGTGTVESTDPYSVKLKTTTDTNATGVYEVESVEVRKGDIVEKGDVLCQLASTENSQVETLNDELEKLFDGYEMQVIREEVSEWVLNNVKSGRKTSESEYDAMLLAREDAITACEEDLESVQDTLEAWQTQAGHEVDSAEKKQAVTNAQNAYDAAAKVIDDAKAEIAGWKQEMETNNQLIQDYQDGKLVIDTGVPAVTEAQANAAMHNNTKLQARITEKEAEIAQKQGNLTNLQAALDKAKAEYNNELGDIKDNVEDSVEDWTAEVEYRTELLQDAKDEKAKLINDYICEKTWSNEVANLKEKIAKLQKETVGGEIVAPISGEIIEVNVRSGEDTPSDGKLFAIQPQGKGYTMEFTVTNEQAKRVAVGNKAELVNSWRYDDVEVTLSNIRPNPANPSQSKLLVFDIVGDVTEGQSLSVALGERSSDYDLTVPNNAIREDNNGKFILTVVTKSTPLSNRYIATRVDVEVLASDDTRSAISAPIYGYDYVITTSTAPVTAGSQVRLANE